MERARQPVVLRYSMAFKRQVVEEVESGQVTVESARRKYSIGGGETIQKWIRKFGKNHLLAKVVRVESPKERDRTKEIKRRNRELEKALADSQIKILSV